MNFHGYLSRPFASKDQTPVQVDIWLEPHTIEWVRKTRQFSSIQLRCSEIIEEAERGGNGRPAKLCKCGCGTSVFGRKECATAACRKRYQRRLRVEEVRSQVSHLTVTRPNAKAA